MPVIAVAYAHRRQVPKPDRHSKLVGTLLRSMIETRTVKHQQPASVSETDVEDIRRLAHQLGLPGGFQSFLETIS